MQLRLPLPGAQRLGAQSDVICVIWLARFRTIDEGGLRSRRRPWTMLGCRAGLQPIGGMEGINLNTGMQP